MTDDADLYCAAQARAHDPDRYFAALFANADTRADLMTLSAFDVELQRVRTAAREPLLADMRLQWWRDAVERLFDAAPDAHPVCVALARCAARTEIPRDHLVELIDAHSAERDETAPDPLAAARAQAGAFLALGVHILAPAGMEALSTARVAAAEAFAQARMLRTARRAAAGARHSHETLGEASRTLEEGARAQLTAARAAFRAARVHEALPAFLPLALVPLYLKAGTGDIPLHRKLMRLAAAGLTGRF